MEKINNTITTTSSSSSTATVSTTSVITPGPSPTSWTDIGCYVEDPVLPILEENLSPEGGDTALSIPKCENACYLKAYVFAGVQEGNQCWCGSYVGGEWASNQTYCNTTCTGDSKTFCGGKGLVNVFKAEENEESTGTTATTTGTSITTTATGSAISETQSSGAIRNLALL
ncbi:putative wsc domain protein [Daldinia childiae]|nr:putative wsc domain protein [Daldinia childiae]KAF3055551.1 putative wsc domain protein [Daldinia childiae]